MEQHEEKRLLRNDVIFIAVLLAVVLIAGACLYLFRGEGDTVTVEAPAMNFQLKILTITR